MWKTSAAAECLYNELGKGKVDYRVFMSAGPSPGLSISARCTAAGGNVKVCEKGMLKAPGGTLCS